MKEKKGMRIYIILLGILLLSGCSNKLRIEDLLKEGSGGSINAFLRDRDEKFISKLRDGDSKEIRQGDTVVVRMPYTETVYVSGGSLLEQRQNNTTLIVVIKPLLDNGATSTYIEVEAGEKQIGFSLKLKE